MITFENFSFKYDTQSEPTLKHITLSIEKGQKVLIIGPSGSGKSTLGHLLNGIVPNSYQGEKEGIFTINGKDAFGMSIYEKSQLVSTVLQDTDGQFIGLTVSEDMAFALENDCVACEQLHLQVAKWAERLALEPLLNQRPQDLSGGQKQRVSLGGVLIDESPILLFDEPLANLDPYTGQETISLIDALHQQEDVTTIIIEHRLEDVLYRSVDKIILLNDGQIIFDGEPDALLKTNLLQEHGIREPLHISSLRQHGYDVSQFSSVTTVSQLNITPTQLPLLSKSKNVRIKEPLLTLENIQFGYDASKPILKDINVTIHKGEKIAIVGRNGAGKSTLAKVLCQFVTATGAIFYKGENISEDTITQRASRIGYVLQNPNQMISQTQIFDEVALGLRLRGLSEDEIQNRVYAVLKVCGLYAYRNWPISALSYGQKKRVSIASILVYQPDVIVLDEPTAGQDMKHYQEMLVFLDELNQAGHTIIMITHDMQLMMEYSERTLVLVDGVIVADTTPEEVLSSPELVRQAHLKTTSLFDLANQLAIDPLALTQDYMVRRAAEHV